MTRPKIAIPSKTDVFHGLGLGSFVCVLASCMPLQTYSPDRSHPRLALNEKRALNHLLARYPELQIFQANPGLPPRAIQSAKLENGDWTFAFAVLGSGVPGIRKAACYRAYRTGEIDFIGQFAGERAHPVDRINPATCRPR